MRRIWAAALCALAAVSLGAAPMPALAQEPVRIAVGFGLAFLPLYICEDLKLVEKHAKEDHLDVKVNYRRFTGPGQIEAAIGSGEIDMGPFGTAPLLAAWANAKGKPQQILAVSGITTMPLTLLSNRADVQSLADLKPADRIAMPSYTAPQMYLLEMQSAKVFGEYDRLAGQVVALSPSDAAAALVAGTITAYFASPPFTEIALHNANIHKIFASADVVSGKASFLILGATRAYIEAHPKVPDIVAKAVDDAARIIRDEPRRAAQIYLAHEPSRVLTGATVEAVLREIRDEFGSAVHGVQSFADFMGRHREIEVPPQNWKEIVAPSLLNSPSS